MVHILTSVLIFNLCERKTIPYERKMSTILSTNGKVKVLVCGVGGDCKTVIGQAAHAEHRNGK